MRLLQRGCSGDDVAAWQAYLRGSGYQNVLVDGVYGPGTHQNTTKWQAHQGLTPDGVVGPASLRRAVVLGWQPQPSISTWKVQPMSSVERAELFGDFYYEHAPTENNPEHIKVESGWRKKNIVGITVPQTKRKLWFHVKVANQFKAAFEEISHLGLSHYIKTFNGSYVPRFIRGSRSKLSNHSYGTAIDINAKWNRLGEIPAAHKPGTVRELVPVFLKHGIYWGGYFRHPDGMHFEVFEIQ